MSDSRIATDFDADADGKQLTRLFVPSPSDRSAWGADRRRATAEGSGH